MNLANFLAHYFSINITPFCANKLNFTGMVIMHTEVSVIYPHFKSVLSFAVVWEVITLPAGREVQLLYWLLGSVSMLCGLKSDRNLIPSPCHIGGFFGCCYRWITRF